LPHPRTPARRNDGAGCETYVQAMPIAIAYSLSFAPFLMLGFALLRLTRA